jgi:hypothetical protein
LVDGLNTATSLIDYGQRREALQAWQLTTGDWRHLIAGLVDAPVNGRDVAHTDWSNTKRLWHQYGSGHASPTVSATTPRSCSRRHLAAGAVAERPVPAHLGAVAGVHGPNQPAVLRGPLALRMFAGLAASVVFAFVYAAAARLSRAEKVLIPVLDILQSVPILGFTSVTVTAFINLFPGSQLGLECASVFAIFTSMAWNMTFAFHQSLITQPRDLDEAARVTRLTKWQRFWQLDVPGRMIPPVWNGMMSFGGPGSSWSPPNRSACSGG